ncbi:MAG: efflux RND transporter permease subunit [Desulfomonile tiedjei]|uniref:Efflux RND transporter permease subunit n=1 Tax=Desulfomonile tiedjei TaxID=2358 RepID=A0A9D6V742_9BACT|nr:efflux RND transporter permease subunit [Desulfomonile tiedjei]
MTISEPFVRRPVMTIVLTASVILFGVLSYLQLPINDLPVVDYPVIQVQADYPGATPETMANNIATPLERQFMQISGLELVSSQNSQGHTNMSLQFALDKSIDAAATDVETAISQATGNLPSDLPSRPTLSKTNPNNEPMMFLTLTSDTVTAGELYDYAYTQVAQRISILSGVSRCSVFGTKSAVRIKANPGALWARGLSIEDLATAIQKGTSYSAAGQLDGPDDTILLRPRGQLENAQDYGNLIITSKDGAPVYLSDLAQVKESVEDERISSRFWFKGLPSPGATVTVAVFRQAGANAVDVANRIKELLPLINQELPASIQATINHDRSKTIASSIHDVQETLVIAFVVVVIVIFVFLGRVEDTLIPVVALPLSLLATFIVMSVLGYSLDNLSLMALTLAIGFLVDDAIVFLENTVRRMEAGEKALAATINSAKEISFTILSMTLSLAAVFIPLVFMSGLMGRIFREFAITIVVAILASGLISLTLTPLMCARLLKNRGEGCRRNWMERVMGALEKRVLNFYQTSLWWFLKRRWISVVIWFTCLAGTVWLFIIVPKAFLPVGDSGNLWGMLVGDEAASPERMRSAQQQAIDILDKTPGVRAAFSMTGNSQMTLSNQGVMVIFLDSPEERSPIQYMAGELMGKLSGIPGILAFLRPMPVLEISTGAVNRDQGQYSFCLSGLDANSVYEVSGRLMEKFREYPGFATVSTDYYPNMPSLEIDIRRNQAKTFGVSEQRVLSLLGKAYAQNYLYLIKKATDQYEVILEVEDKARSKPEDLTHLYIKSDDAKNLVPLDALITTKTVLGPQSVNHMNQFTSVTFSLNLQPGVAIGEATEFINRTASEVVPSTMRASLQGEASTFQNTIKDMTVLMALAVFVMYVILAILYESYIHPITVLSTLPTALFGGLLTLLLFNEQASLYAFVGMFMLMGIVKKNGIMIVDFALQRVEKGETAEQAIHDASMDRFRPIIMTTIAAIGGAVPIALGFGADAASRRPLGLVIVGGMVLSQFITLYITPVIYLYLEEFQEKVLDRTSFFRSRHSKQLSEVYATPRDES